MQQIPILPKKQPTIARAPAMKAVTLEETFPPLPARQPAIPTGNIAKYSHRALLVLTLMVAIMLAAIAAYFSITGMAAIFPGAALAVMVMDGAIECGKLAGAAWLSRKWRDMGPVRVPLAALIAVAALINSVGVFGQLSAAHLSPHTLAAATIGAQASTSKAMIDMQMESIKDFDHRIDQIDAAIAEATKRGRTTAAMALVDQQKASRAEIVEQRNSASLKLVGLKSQMATVTAEQQRADADVGVLQYAANLFGVERERMIQLLILAMVLTCDPLSIALVVATSQRRK